MNEKNEIDAEDVAYEAIMSEKKAIQIITRSLLKKLKKMNCTQSSLANLLQCRQSVLSEILSNKRKLSLSRAIRWCKYLKVIWVNVLYKDGLATQSSENTDIK